MTGGRKYSALPSNLKLALISLLLMGCNHSAPKIAAPQVDIYIGNTTGDGYIYEIWKRPNGGYYFKRNGITADIVNP